MRTLTSANEILLTRGKLMTPPDLYRLASLLALALSLGACSGAPEDAPGEASGSEDAPGGAAAMDSSTMDGSFTVDTQATPGDTAPTPP